MKAVQLTHPSLDAFERVDLDPPVPRRGEALVRMKAASLNFIDLAVATGAYPGPVFPLVPVADGAGDVVAIGPEVDTLRIGDRVAVHPKALWAAGRGSARTAREMRGVNLPGSLREFVRASADTLVKVPPQLSWEQAASLPIAATTAWNALATANIGPGSVVVVLGTGGVSIFAIQLAAARGAEVIVTSSSDEKLARAQGIGARHGVNYRRTPEWDCDVLSITGGIGADLVLEAAGAQTFARSLNAVRHGGTVFTIGFLSGAKAEVDLMTIIAKSIRVQGNNTGSAADLADAVAAIAMSGMEPVLAKTFGIGDVREAYDMLAAGGPHFGKLVMGIDFNA